MKPIPFGYRLAPHEREQAAIQRMTAMRKEGMTYRAIAAAIQSEGVAVSYTTVKRTLDLLGVD